jgi:nitrogen fixation/metabolism regulation signal transduction histidine kinase
MKSSSVTRDVESPPVSPGKSKRPLDQHILSLAWLIAIPGSLIALMLVWTGDYDLKIRWTTTILIVSAWWIGSLLIRSRLLFSLRTLSNLLAALREGDYSIRARMTGKDDALEDVVREINSLGETLRLQRLGALEATTLLRKVMSEIDAAVFAFDSNSKLRLVNRAGERLLGKHSEQLLDASASDIGLDDCLHGVGMHTLERDFGGRKSRWGIRRSNFREGGYPHQLLVISDLSKALREEERQAWQRLVRVLGHELNNSLAPITSISESLYQRLQAVETDSELTDDLKTGLEVISSRAQALSRFMEAYSRLARLPKPLFKNVRLSSWIHRAVELETRMEIPVREGEDLSILADPDQLDQILINLLRNAVDAVLETNGTVYTGWKTHEFYVEIFVVDNGPGIANMSNLFVPFFTTKPNGSGIGLVLSRQIAEAHGGSLSLENHPESGCIAKLNLPLSLS